MLDVRRAQCRTVERTSTDAEPSVVFPCNVFSEQGLFRRHVSSLPLHTDEPHRLGGRPGTGRAGTRLIHRFKAAGIRGEHTILPRQGPRNPSVRPLPSWWTDAGPTADCRRREAGPRMTCPAHRMLLGPSAYRTAQRRRSGCMEAGEGRCRAIPDKVLQASSQLPPGRVRSARPETEHARPLPGRA